jgi:hypothetical protein
VSDLDYISLNVPRLLSHFVNPTPDWHAKVVALATTQLRLFHKHSLIRHDAEALRLPIEKAVVRFSDYTPEGQAFVRSGAVEKWLTACDRKGSVEAYEDPALLERRIRAFLDGK